MGTGFDFNVIAPSYCSAVFPLSLDMVHLFRWVPTFSLSKVCSAANGNLGVLEGEDERIFNDILINTLSQRHHYT